MAETKEQLLEENETLRARILELEDELKRSKKGPRIFDRETSNQIRDLPTEASEQVSRFVRALSLAAVESARISGEVLTEFANDVLARNQASAKRTPGELAMNLPRDITSAGVNAMERSVRLQRQVVERFSDAYGETTKKESTGT
jgi:hypothetical protein